MPHRAFALRGRFLLILCLGAGLKLASPASSQTCPLSQPQPGSKAGPEQCGWEHQADASQDKAPAQAKASQGKESERAGPSSSGQGWEATDVAGEYIVRFNDYRPAEAHRTQLQSSLEMGEAADTWSWVPRNNAAAKYPTDFGVLRLAARHAETLLAQLVLLPFVKDAHPQRRVTRSLAWAPADPEGSEASGERGLPPESLGDLGGDHARGLETERGGPSHHTVRKRPGRFQTRGSEGLAAGAEWGLEEPLQQPVGNHTSRRLLQRQGVPLMFSADQLWEQGFRGAGVKMGVFDTGIRSDHPHVKNIRERTNWTHEPTLEDGLGHGTFVAGVIGGIDSSCPGFAPEVELHTFRVFTNDQVSYTSWFLDAFNYAMATEMNVVNLSIGGPDYLDRPFVEKVWEITSSGILMVSAIGNDGPLYGTLNNPADQSDVIGVGGIDYADRVAAFSSRGMSTWELPRGYGRAKPDVMAYGRDVMGSRIQGGCRSLSGTSVASPVVAGAVCLLASIVPQANRWHWEGGILNPASMKQALVEGAVPIQGIPMYEQGQGKINLLRSMEVLKNYTPRASVVPAELDLMACPFMWPFCRQPLYAQAMPTMVNTTVLNGMGLTGRFEEEPVFTPSNAGGRLLSVIFEHSEVLWPWSGHLALYLRVVPEGQNFTGEAAGKVSFSVISPGLRGEAQPRRSRVSLPIKLQIVPTPPRQKRVLWDQWRSIRYPPAYIPRDSLEVRNDILDWHGDHPHTNYHDLYDALRDAGLWLEVLGSPLTCFDASQYGALLLVDPEEETYAEEVSKLAADVAVKGLGLIVIGEWYNVDTMVKMRFFDDNTRSWWTPATGGANIPAVNELLAPFGVAFGDAVLEGPLQLLGEKLHYASGTNIVKFPAGGTLHSANLPDKAVAGVAQASGKFGGQGNQLQAILGLTDHQAGRVAVYGDSNCLDSSHRRSSCQAMLLKLIRWATKEVTDPELLPPDGRLESALGSASQALPSRRVDTDMTPYSKTLRNPLVCFPNAPSEFQDTPLHRGASAAERQAAVSTVAADTLGAASTTLREASSASQLSQEVKAAASDQPADKAKPIPSKQSQPEAVQDPQKAAHQAGAGSSDSAQAEPGSGGAERGGGGKGRGGGSTRGQIPRGGDEALQDALQAEAQRKEQAAADAAAQGQGGDMGAGKDRNSMGTLVNSVRRSERGMEEASGRGSRAHAFGVGGDGVPVGKSGPPTGRLSPASLFIQVLAVAGTVGVFGLWHFSRRRRGSAGPQLQRSSMANPLDYAVANLRRLLRARPFAQRGRVAA